MYTITLETFNLDVLTDVMEGFTILDFVSYSELAPPPGVEQPSIKIPTVRVQVALQDAHVPALRDMLDGKPPTPVFVPKIITPLDHLGPGGQPR